MTALGLEWARPDGLWSLLLPVAVIVLARVFARPAEAPTGTLGLWRRSGAESAEGGRRARWRVPLPVILAALALSFGGLALAGPRRPQGAGGRTWTIVVDTSPSMFLDHEDHPTRLDAALAACERFLDSACGSDRRVFVEASGPRAAEDSLPEEWRGAPAAPRAEVHWSRYDLPGALWVTDREPTEDPACAGVFAAGGAQVPGPVAWHGRALAVWDGEQTATREDALPERSTTTDGELPEVLAQAFAAWSEARGFGATGPESSERTVALTFRGAGGVGAEATLGRDGWSLRCEGVELTLAAEERAWLSGQDGEALVVWRPGLVRSGLTSADEPGGDPAAFAVSWATLFDKAVAPPPGLVSLAERQDAGAEVFRPPAAAAPDGAGARSNLELGGIDALLAAASALFAAAAGIAMHRSHS